MKFTCVLVIPLALWFAAATSSKHQIDAGLQGYWILSVEKSDFGSNPKPKMGAVNWTERGWAFAIVTADGSLYTDAVAIDDGCKLIGVSAGHSCQVKVFTPQHLQITLRQGAAVRRVGDIELIDKNTTKTTHRVTPANGAPYVEKTIWERQQ